MRNIFIFCLTSNKKYKTTAEFSIYKEMKKKASDCNVQLLSIKYSMLLQNNNEFYLTNVNGERILLQHEDIFIIRRSYEASENCLRLITYLRDLSATYNFKFYSHPDMLEFAKDKYRDYMFFESNNLPTPKTVYIPKISMKTSDENIYKVAEELGYPLIIKPLDKSLGTGVVLIESENQLKSIAEVMFMNYGGFILQEFIKCKYDVRVFTFNNKIVSSMQRNKIDNDFRTNYSKGATVEKYELSDTEHKLIINLFDALSEKFDFPIGTLGIDFIKDENDKMYFLELNASPGVEGISTTIGFSMAKIVSYLILKNENLIN